MLLQSLQPLPGEDQSIPIMSASAVAAADVTVVERQMAHLYWQQQQRLRLRRPQSQQQQPSYFSATIATDASLTPTPHSIPQPPHVLPSSTISLHPANFCSGGQGMINHDLSEGSATVWPDVAHEPMLCNSCPGGSAVHRGGGDNTSRTFSGPPVVTKVDSMGRLTPPLSQLEHASNTKDGAEASAAVAALSPDAARESSKKRKSTERASTNKLEEDCTEKKMIKVEDTRTLVEPKEESPTITSSSTAIIASNCKDNNGEASSNASEEKPRALPKTDYIHVRARRGQATDSHSLAERVRREKISERMKLLQELVPGCNKITGKAGMLDEIINYVQSLQKQVEFLSMKLAAVTPALDFNLAALITKEVSILPGGGGSPAQMGALPPELLGLPSLQYPLQHQAMAAAAAADCCSLSVPMVSSRSPAVEALCSIAAGPVPAAPDSCVFPDSCNIMVHTLPLTTSGWDGDLQSFYSSMGEFGQERPAASVPADAPVAPFSTFQPLISQR